jgi:hypothetical protein
MGNRRGRHSSRAGLPVGLILGISGAGSVVAGFIILLVALDKLLAYSPVGNPEAGRVGFTLLGMSVLFIGIPVVSVVALALVSGLRRHSAWMKTLTPRERLAVRVGETAMMEAGHIAWRDHNRAEDARLSASVIGAAPQTEGPGDGA